MIDETSIKFDEKTILKLRSLYRKYGYLPYKMSKFEEYALYAQNKDFLVSDRVITFTDTNGKLMALKPDVTLSIIKSCEDIPGVKQKLYYNENVYRVCDSTHRFKEIMQTGLECIGENDLYDIFEVISLAAESLASLRESFCLDISSLSLVYDIVSPMCADDAFLREVIRCISEKNPHDLKKVCLQYGLSESDYETVNLFISLYGPRKKVLDSLRSRVNSQALDELDALDSLLSTLPYSDKIRFDFSVVNDMNYYNGFVFRGFIDEISSGVLSGGQYDRMMEKMNRKSKAVGFALYLDRLQELNDDRAKVDVDVLLLYDNKTDVLKLAEAVSSYIREGLTVSAQKSVPPKLRYGKTVDLRTSL